MLQYIKKVSFKLKSKVMYLSMNSTIQELMSSFPFKRPSGTEPPVEYAILRNTCPVSKVSIVDNTSWAWLLTKHSDIVKVLIDNDNFSKIRTRQGFPEITKGGRLAAASHKPTFVDMDPPEHTEQRRMASPMFSADYVDTKLVPMIHEIAESKLKDLLASSTKSADLVATFALPMVSEVMYRLLGIPVKDTAYLSSCNAVRTNGSATAAQASAANKELVEYLTKLVKSKATELNTTASASASSDDIISLLVRNQLQPNHISLDDLVQVIFLLLVAGNATTVSMIALGVKTLLNHPDQLKMLISAPRRYMPNAVEELCRLHTASALATRRVALKDITIRGTLVRAGEGVIAATESGNRDADVFADPDAFDMHRVFTPETKSLAFGHGPHQCIAEVLAKREVEIALTTLFHALPALQLPDEMTTKYFPLVGDVGITEMHVSW